MSTNVQPTCTLGYTESDLDKILGRLSSRREKFNIWMRGQTVAICNGLSYNHEGAVYEISCGGEEHGMIVYPWDLDRFLAGLPVID